ncbi:MAG: hypothetical protein N3B21_11310 [Clostridia bacterium]|nr:hypothetical protein [Clostridia bacterium]
MDSMVKIAQLKQGDILLFSTYDDWESKLISLITNSSVSHSAMSYFDYNQIVEETPPCAQINPIKDRIAGRTITVMRLNSNVGDMTKVLDIAKDCVDKQEPYPEVNLALVGIYILFKKSMISAPLQNLLCTLMKIVINKLIELIDSGIYKNSHPMVCSQFVYHCYENAGDSYKLILKDKEYINSLLKSVSQFLDDNMIDIKPKLINNFHMQSEDSSYNSVDLQKLCEDIYNELAKEESNSDHVLSEEFAVTIHKFCLAVNKFISGKDTEASLLHNAENYLVTSPVISMIAMEEAFVTPKDLLSNCVNLYKVGILDNNSTI